MKFNHEAFSSMEDAQCAICLAEYQEKEVLRIMPKCGHSFHLSCIDTWLINQSTCPVCRLSVQDSVKPNDIRTATPSTAQSFDNSDISVEHSQQWLLPAIAHAEDNGSNQRQTDSISIDTGVARDTTLRS